MKTYEETMSAIFSKGNAIITARNNRVRNIKRTSAAVSGVCAAAIVGFTVFKNDDLKNAGNLNNHNDSIITENKQITNETTTQSTTAVTEKMTATTNVTKKTTSHTSEKATSTSTVITKTSKNSINDTSTITQQETITSVTTAVTEKNTDNTQPVSTEQISSDITTITETNTISVSAGMTETSSLSNSVSATTVSDTISNSNTEQTTTTTSDTTNKFHPTFYIIDEETNRFFTESFELSFIKQKFIISDTGEKVYVGEPELLEKWENSVLTRVYTTEYYDRDANCDYILIADKLPENCTYYGENSIRLIVPQFSYDNTIKICKQQEENTTIEKITELVNS